jgi:hypothetical protein
MRVVAVKPSRDGVGLQKPEQGRDHGRETREQPALVATQLLATCRRVIWLR